MVLIIYRCVPSCPWKQGSWGQHGGHLGPTGPRWAPCWPHELCYLGCSPGLIFPDKIRFPLHSIHIQNKSHRINTHTFIYLCSSNTDVVQATYFHSRTHTEHSVCPVCVRRSASPPYVPLWGYYICTIIIHADQVIIGDVSWGSICRLIILKLLKLLKVKQEMSLQNTIIVYHLIIL